MKVILREEVENLGDMGDVVDVADGYGRNHLIPKGLAVRASKRNVKSVEHEKRIQAQRLAKMKGSAEDFSEKLGKLSLRIVRRVGEGDRLFGSVTAKDIADAIQEAGEKIDRRKIQLESPIKALGVYKIPVRVHPEVTAELNVWVEAEEGQPEDSEAEEAATEPAEAAAAQGEGGAGEAEPAEAAEEDISEEPGVEEEGEEREKGAGEESS